jgi:hypothetical protein
MMLELFKLIEHRKAEIVQRMQTRIGDQRPVYGEISAVVLKQLLEELLEGYADQLVTGESDTMDTMFRALSHVLVVRGSRLSDVFQLPLMLDEVIRELVFDERQKPGDSEDALQKFNASIALIEETTHRSACRFLDVFQEHLDGRIARHNTYLEQMQTESGVNLEPFRLVPEGAWAAGAKSD